MEIDNFKSLIIFIRQNKQFIDILKRRQQQYLIKLNLQQNYIPPCRRSNHEELYRFYHKRETSNEEYWYQNQLRVFIYLLFAYLELYHKTIQQLKQDDWNYFSLIFNYKNPIFFEFQAYSIIKTSSKNITWSQQETELLKSIIEQKYLKNRWNLIARQLFIRSHKKFFRNPKQCRQRWMNHLDPSKIRTQWSAQEDLILLTCIKKKGKKWSTAVKDLNNTRTEHMVKNRYKSLIYNQSKKQPAGKKQCQLQNIMIKRLTKLNKSAKNIAPKKQKQTMKLKEQFIQKEKSLKNNSQYQQMIKIQQKQRKNSSQSSLKNDFIWLQKGSNQKIQELNKQFYNTSPIMIPWRGDIIQNDDQQIDINYQDKIKIIIQNQNQDIYQNENENYFLS